MIERAVHVGISVENMKKALDWYERNLGFRLVKDDGFCEPLSARVCFMERDGFQLELFEHLHPKPLPEDRRTPNSDLQTIGTKHLAFQVRDMKALKKKFIANNVDIAHEVTMGDSAVMFVRDNSGVLIEFIQQD